ncbi:hypothetical protein V8C86DRAFT_2574813 [Haematococcus lacustris]
MLSHAQNLRAIGNRSATARGRVVMRANEAKELATTSTKYTNVGPEPKRFSIGDGQLLEIAAASLPFAMRLGAGAFCVGYKTGLPQDDSSYGVLKISGRKLSETSSVANFPRPGKPLELYEFETCPFCKKVREAISMLDLDVMMYPCPKDGDVWRPKAIALGGKKQFPYLVDPNTGTAMYESDAIIQYLFNTYGDGKVPMSLTLGTLTTLTAGLGLLARGMSGGRVLPSKQPEQPLVFWGYDASPFVKVAREALCAMQLPYLYKNVARGSPRRDELLAKYGHFQVPCLEDPNTQSYLFESGAIVRYLKFQYGTGEAAATASQAQPPVMAEKSSAA